VNFIRFRVCATVRYSITSLTELKLRLKHLLLRLKAVKRNDRLHLVLVLPFELYMDAHIHSRSERNCSSDTSTAPCYSNDCLRNSRELPPEILHNIITDVVASYVDLFIMEPRKASTLAHGLEPQQADDDETLPPVNSDVDRTAPRESAEKFPDNIVICLLSVSYLFRDITLKILRDGFGIERTEGRCVIFFDHEVSLCMSFRSPSQNLWNLLKISRDIDRWGRTQTLSQDQIIDTRNSISQSPLLNVYLFLSVVWAWLHDHLDHSILDNALEICGVKGVSMQIRPPKLAQRIVERLV
jgi:hypothetical protein